MGRPSNLSDAQITAQITDLIQNGVIGEGLYELLCRQGYLLLEKRLLNAPKDRLSEEAHNLAIEMLLHIRSKRLLHLRAAAHVMRELGKYLTRRESPAHHEVWKALSQALLELEKEGKAARLSASAGTNSQATEWCLKGLEQAPAVDTQAFFEEAARLPVYHPSRKDGRFISPSQVRELAEQMLTLANGPILMQDLHTEAMKHVVQTMAYAETLQSGAEDAGDQAPISRELADRMPVLGYLLEEEAVERAGMLWKELAESGDDQVLCLYYLPKHLLGRPVTASDLGTPQRISEATQRIRKAFQKSLDLTPTLAEQQEAAAAERHDPSGAGVEGPRARLLGRMAEILIQFCSEKSWDAYLKPQEETP